MILPRNVFRIISAAAVACALGVSDAVVGGDFRSPFSGEEAAVWILNLLRRSPPHAVESFQPEISDSSIFLRLLPDNSAFTTPARSVALPSGRVESIQYVFPQCAPASDLAVRTQIKRGVNTLQIHFPELFNDDLVRWDLVAVTGCKSEREARGMFHGFFIRYWRPPGSDARRGDLDLIKRIKEGRAKESDVMDPGTRRSTVTAVLDRNKKWEKMLIVADLTGSMAPYAGQVLLWFKLNDLSGRAKHFVFFNDGDDKPDAAKIKGETGGIYQAEAKGFDDIADKAMETIRGGNGGDQPENDVEALLEGIKSCPDCQEVVLIADNFADMRDFDLLEKLGRPVRVILCGAAAGVNLQYLELARRTGGSIHTIERDIEGLADLGEGKTLEINGATYAIRKGRFIRATKS